MRAKEKESSREAEIYEGLERHLIFFEKLFVSKISKLIKNGKEFRILDIGTGTATIPIMLCKKNKNVFVTALDYSEEMLKIAKKKIKNNKIESRISLIKANAEKKLPFKDKSFDIVISHHTLHHLSNIEMLLKESLRVCKINGKVIIKDLIRPKNKFLINLYVNIFGFNYGKQGKKLYKNSLNAAFTLKEIKFLMEEAGTKGKISSNFLTHFTIELKKS